jgi:hypothetical protein
MGLMTVNKENSCKHKRGNQYKDTSYFVEKAKEVHGDRYDYSMSVYKSSKDLVEIKCKEHGVFSQRASHHTSGSGCPKCAKEERAKKRRHSQEDFEAKANKVHNNKYDYSKTMYTSGDKKLTIVCPEHGEFRQTGYDHLAGYGCVKCTKYKTLTKEEVVARFNEVHDNKYTYDLPNYKSTKSQITIICPIHGEFKQKATNHLHGNGCKHCQKEAIMQKYANEFVEKARTVHGHKYGYEKTSYTGTNKKITVTCAIHGDFEQVANTHLQGKGCPKCGNKVRGEKVSAHIAENGNNGWSYSEWDKAGSMSNNFEGYSLYIIKCTGNGESFIKIGKTYVGVARRFLGDSAMPYKYKVETQVYHNAYAISKLEEKLHKHFKEYKYKPKKEFAGMYECYDPCILEEAIEKAEK